MIRRYSFGKVFETESVPVIPPAQKGEIPYVKADEMALSFTYRMDPDDIVYGLGENVRGINKRGWIYESKCSDESKHLEDRRSLYAAHNFIVVDGRERFGLFIDYPGILTFDVGYSDLSVLKITASDWNLDAYVIDGNSVIDIVRQFRELIGRSYIAPRWAFGNGQSRWGYVTADDVREVVKRHREAGVPLDMVYLDIDYMERFKDFTVNSERFPRFAEFVEELKAQHVRLIPIIDAAVKEEKGYPVYDEGIEKGYFCTNSEGRPFVGAVWPGRSLFTDMLNKEARDWFGSQYKVLLDQGIEGFWNDMNEPSIFYAEDRLADVLEKIAQMREGDQNLDLDAFNHFKDLVGSLSANPEDYKKFYHTVGGEKIRHDKVHNLYGYNMTRAAGEAFERLVPDKRVLMFSRASCIGMHRYGGIWQGDNKSYWGHLLMNLKMLPSLNMCGFLYTGADIGGFGSDTTEDLVMRWYALGIFTPLMRNHSEMGTRKQEFYQFRDYEGFKSIIRFRYRLLPYLYSEYMKAALRGDMMFRPLAWDHPEDARCRTIEDQLYLGGELMIAPVYEQNARGRMVYLPERMKMLRHTRDGLLEEKVLEKGDHGVLPPRRAYAAARKGRTVRRRGGFRETDRGLIRRRCRLRVLSRRRRDEGLREPGQLVSARGPRVRKLVQRGSHFRQAARSASTSCPCPCLLRGHCDTGEREEAWRKNGGMTKSPIRSTPRALWTATVTASGTCRALFGNSITLRIWAWISSGSLRSTHLRWRMKVMTSPIITR